MSATHHIKRSASGRPTRQASEALMRHVLDVAQRHFTAAGFEGASIEGIAQDAGVSKLTLYRHFESKQGLFVAMVERQVSSYARQQVGKIDVSRPPREILLEMGLFLAKSYFTNETQGLTRILIGEHRRVDGLAAQVDRMGRLARSPIETYLRLLQKRGLAVIDDVPLAAAQFVNLCMLGQYYLLCRPSRALPSARTRTRLVQSAVDMFTATYLRASSTR